VNAEPGAAGGEAPDTLREDIEIARAAAAAARTVPEVERITTGGLVGVATDGRGEVVRGVAVRRERGVLDVEIHVAMRIVGTRDLIAAAEPVRRGVRQAIARVATEPIGRVDIAIDDLVFESEGV
jgi:hypothetical protein